MDLNTLRMLVAVAERRKLADVLFSQRMVQARQSAKLRIISEIAPSWHQRGCKIRSSRDPKGVLDAAMAAVDGFCRAG